MCFMYGKVPVFYIKVINVTGLNAVFVPHLLVFRVLHSVTDLPVCKRMDSFTNQFQLNYIIHDDAVLSAVKIWVLWDVMKTAVPCC